MIAMVTKQVAINKHLQVITLMIDMEIKQGVIEKHQVDIILTINMETKQAVIGKHHQATIPTTNMEIKQVHLEPTIQDEQLNMTNTETRQVLSGLILPAELYITINMAIKWGVINKLS